MAKSIIDRMILALGNKLFSHEPKTPEELKYYLKYGEHWHQKCYPHKYTNSTGPK